MSAQPYTISMILLALAGSTVLLLVGVLLRQVVPKLQSLHLPASVVAGLMALVLGPEVLGPYLYQNTAAHETIDEIYQIWKVLPAYLITVVFASLMMGGPIPNPKAIWRAAAPHLMVGYIMAWGQYVVGVLVVMLVLAPALDANILSSALIAIGFQGGYGTAAGLGSTYSQLGFENGYDLALGMATAGKVIAILLGLFLINVAVKRNKLQAPEDSVKDHIKEDVPQNKANSDYRRQRREMHYSTDALVVHFSLLALAIAIGWGMKQGLLVFEGLFLAAEDEGFVQYIPLFPMALLGGIVVQVMMRWLPKSHLIDPRRIQSLGHSFLDMIILVAIATLSPKVLADNWQLLLALVGAGVGWNLLVFLLVAPRIYNNAYWARGLADFAHSTGAATTGLMLIKVIDPNDQTGAKSGFSLKQPFYEPIVGGGLVTALALPLMHVMGLGPFLVLTSVLLGVTIIAAWRLVGINRRNPVLDQ